MDSKIDLTLGTLTMGTNVVQRSPETRPTFDATEGQYSAPSKHTERGAADYTFRISNRGAPSP